MINKELFESHLKNLGISFSKDSRHKNRFIFNGNSISVQELSKQIAMELKYNFGSTYDNLDAISFERELVDLINTTYAQRLDNRQKNQLAKQNDKSLKISIGKLEGIEPTKLINDEDKRMWQNFYYCEEDKVFYIKDGINFKFAFAEVPSTKEAINAFITQYKHLFDETFTEKFNRAIIQASSDSIVLHNTLKVVEAKELFSMHAFDELTSMVDENHKDNVQLLTEDYFQGLIIGDLLDNKTPSTLWKGFVQIAIKNTVETDEDGKSIIVWNGFYAKTFKQVAVTIGNYIRNFFENYPEELKAAVTHIKKKPVFISTDNDEIAVNSLNKNYKDNLAPVHKIEDTTLWNYLNTLPENMREYVCAWCYNTILPQHDEPIHLVLWDLGGTGKTSLLANTMNSFTKLLYNNEYFYIKGDDFNDLTARYDKDHERDMADSIFCLVDDIETSMLESFANMTGSSHNTITIKKLYANPYQKTNNTKFILATNNALSVKRPDAFRRRIAIVHTYEANTWKKTLNAKEFERIFNEDALTILEYWKTCYESIIKKYNSLVNAASTIPEIARELENATDVSENVDEMLNELIDRLRSKNTEDGFFSNPDWKTEIDSIRADFPYLKEVKTAIVRNKMKTMKMFDMGARGKDGARGIRINFTDTKKKEFIIEDNFNKNAEICGIKKKFNEKHKSTDEEFFNSLIVDDWT